MKLQRVKYPPKKDVLIISDWPIKSEIDSGYAYSSASNLQFIDKLQQAGIEQKNCFTTYLSFERPEENNWDFRNYFKSKKDLIKQQGFYVDENLCKFYKLEEEKDLFISEELVRKVNNLCEEIEKVNPKIIILTGKWLVYLFIKDITYLNTKSAVKTYKPYGELLKYRASCLNTDFSKISKNVIIFPMLPYSIIYRIPEKTPIVLWDIKKIAYIYNDLKQTNNPQKYLNRVYNFKITENFTDVLNNLHYILYLLEESKLRMAVDIETMYNTIDCFSIALENGEVYWIPLATENNPNLWTLDQEFQLISIIRLILTHKNKFIIGQNFFYDAQFFWKYYLIKVDCDLDTMVLHHVLHNTLPKSLDFLASVYVDEYSYWKSMQVHEK